MRVVPSGGLGDARDEPIGEEVVRGGGCCCGEALGGYGTYMSRTTHSDDRKKLSVFGRKARRVLESSTTPGHVPGVRVYVFAHPQLLFCANGGGEMLQQPWYHLERNIGFQFHVSAREKFDVGEHCSAVQCVTVGITRSLG